MEGRPYRMDAELWFRDWALQYDGFPDNYLAFDVESTGSDLAHDLIVQLGWCEIEKGEISTQGSCVLNWVRSPYVDPNWLRRRMETTGKEMLEKHNKVYPWEYSQLSTGVDPLMALNSFLEKLIEIREEPDKIIVVHNGIGFDVPMITTHFKRFLNCNFNFEPYELWDTGAMEKAVQIDELLCPGELPGDFAHRILLRSNDGVKWGLHNHAIPKYGLDVKYNLDMTKAHTADFDSYVTHLLFETYRDLAEKGLERQE